MKWLLSLIGVSPYALLAGLLGALGLFGAGYWRGGHAARADYAAAELKAQAVAVETFKREEITLNVVSVNLEKRLGDLDANFTTITRTVDRIVDRPIYRNACFDDDGLRAANSAILGQAIDPAKPDDALPIANTAR